MEDFFAGVEGRTHAWPPGRKDLHWLIVPGEDFARKRLYEPYRVLSEQPGLHSVQPQWMHCTVLHAGPQDSASTREVDQIIREVTRRAADTDPYEMTLSRPDIGTVAIESKGYPGRPHRELWEMTWQAHCRAVGDRWPRIPAVSYPSPSLPRLRRCGGSPGKPWRAYGAAVRPAGQSGHGAGHGPQVGGRMA
ncbi:hypothetical protein ACIQPR_09080 [Streptomyces sp. NPDC091280]|uniref:hypothetical protein n=1 Tax=Streptomyces sp. NPDC091280 TaxID=3365984 RepID=UPI0037F71D5F